MATGDAFVSNGDENISMKKSEKKNNILIVSLFWLDDLETVRDDSSSAWHRLLKGQEEARHIVFELQI